MTPWLSKLRRIHVSNAQFVGELRLRVHWLNFRDRRYKLGAVKLRAIQHTSKASRPPKMSLDEVEKNWRPNWSGTSEAALPLW